MGVYGHIMYIQQSVCQDCIYSKYKADSAVVISHRIRDVHKEIIPKKPHEWGLKWTGNDLKAITLVFIEY